MSGGSFDFVDFVYGCRFWLSVAMVVLLADCGDYGTGWCRAGMVGWGCCVSVWFGGFGGVLWTCVFVVVGLGCTLFWLWWVVLVGGFKVGVALRGFVFAWYFLLTLGLRCLSGGTFVLRDFWFPDSLVCVF